MKPFSWPVTAFLTSLMALHVAFFNSPAAVDFGTQAPGWMAPLSAYSYNLFVLGLFVLLLRSGNVARYRRIFFVSIALLFFPTFIANIVEVRGQMALGAEHIFQNQTPFCHIVLPIVAIPMALTRTLIFPAALSHGYASFFSMLTIWLAASVILGRGWCSWVCFYGGWDDGCSRLRKKAAIRISPKNDRLRYGGFAVLLFVVLASLPTMTAVYCDWLCPFKMITEYSEITGFQTMLGFILMVILFFGVTLLLPALTRKRIQCTALCPFGAFQSIAGRISPFRLAIDHRRCVKCMRCVQACPTLSLPPEVIKENRSRPLPTCTLCGECISACPEGAIDYTVAFHDRIPRCGEAGNASDAGSAGREAGSATGRIKGFWREVLHPAALLQFAGVSFGFVIASSFATGTIYRLLHLIVQGSFLLQSAPGGAP